MLKSVCLLSVLACAPCAQAGELTETAHVCPADAIRKDCRPAEKDRLFHSKAVNTDLQIRKGFGKIIGNCAAANDKSIFDLMCLQPNLFKEKSCIFGCCDNRDKIAIVNQMITARDA